MYYVKLVELRMRFCPVCKIMVLHECGSLLHQMEDDGVMIPMFTVYECLGCGYLYDQNGLIFQKEYKKL